MKYNFFKKIEQINNDEEKSNLLNKITNNLTIRKSLMSLSFLTLFGSGSVEKPPIKVEEKSDIKQTEIYSNPEKSEKNIELTAEQQETVNAIMIMTNSKFDNEIKTLMFNIEIMKLKRDEAETPKELETYNYYLNNYRKEFESALPKINITPSDRNQALEKFNDLNQMVDSIKNEIKIHIESKEYLNKLTIELDSNVLEATVQQQIRLKNLANLKCNFVSLEALNSDSNVEMFSYYLGGTVNIYLPYNSEDEEYLKAATYHEILHEVTLGEKNISKKTIQTLKESYTTKNSNYGYFFDPSERLVRKQVLDLEMEKLGIKKYGEKFTHEHYNQLIRLYNNNKLSQDADRLLETTKPEYFEKLMNEIAQNNTNIESEENKA
ncbi:MAG TPA: hypothetical protein PLE28_00715 [bacterium]|nr:hypothetical protein [bacterium]